MDGGLGSLWSRYVALPLTRFFEGIVLRRQMERQGKEVDVTQAAVDLLTEKGYSPAYGARFLKRHIDEKVKLPLTAMWKGASQFQVDYDGTEITITALDAPSVN